MTVDPLTFQSATSIASPERFYPADIEVSHPQLRNFISTVYSGKIFYVNRYDVYILDLETNQRSILVTVPFEARCLAADHGWVCVGGETKGDCAFVHIGEQDGQPGNFCHELIVDMMGKEIVNSMTIQLLKPEVEGYKDETVVLISNNDHTVTIYSLTQRTILATVEHPRPMNHAVLCPDSTIMAAVGDENKVYFMKRILDEEDPDTPPRAPRFPNYDWRPICAPDVPKGNFQADDFSFAVAFSPDGRLCAVSSQGGAITIFDMEAIADELEPAEDAIICSFRSSRGSLWGCVRSMTFSPAPWDILAWAEDHGRIGLADVRQGFVRRQQIELNREKAKDVDIKDTTPSDWKDLDVKERLQRQHQQRMQALRGHPPLGARSLIDSHRRQARTDDPALDSLHALSDRERAVIQSLEQTIDEIGSPPGPFSINYTSAQPRVRPSASSPESSREYEVQLLNPSSRNANTHRPRRRSSVVLSESHSGQHLAVDESARMTMTASPGPMSDDGVQGTTTNSRSSTSTTNVISTADLPPIMSTNDLTPTAASASQPLPYNIPVSDPWHVIEASLATNRNRLDNPSRQAEMIGRIETEIMQERQLATRLERQLADEQRLSASLRFELESRERLLEIRQRELRSEPPGEGELSPSLERLLQRRLYSERDHGLRRSEELEEEFRSMSRRVNFLMDERDAILRRHRILQGQPHSHSTSSIARTSALPTRLVNSDLDELARRIQTMQENRQQRAQRLQDLEHQVRRAESRIELASLQSNVDHIRARTRAATGEADDSSVSPSTSTPTSRFLPNATPAFATAPPTDSNSSNGNTSTAISDARRLLETFDSLPSLSPTASAMARRLRQNQQQRTETNLQFGTGSGSTSTTVTNRATIPRIAELANSASNSASASTPTSTATSASATIFTPSTTTTTTPSSNTGSSSTTLPTLMRIPDHDLRIARLMLARGSADMNGNWNPAAAHRYLAGGPGGLFGLLRAAGAAAGTGTGAGFSAQQPGLEDILREGGVGTAGLGFSPDGLKLFAASEKGIFEFKLNVQDRMQCPVIEMR